MDFQKWMEMDPDEQREFAENQLADVAEVWMGDTLDDVLVRSMVGAMRSLMEGAMALTDRKEETEKINPYVMGLWVNAYTKMLNNWASVVGITDMKKKMQGNG